MPKYSTAMSDVLDVLIVGCGRIAGGFDEDGGTSVRTHAGAYRAHRGFRVVACVDPDPARREAFMDHWTIPSGYDDIDGARRAGITFDIASICSPTQQHAADIEHLLAFGIKAVFCEKPIAPSLDAASAAVAACEKAAVRLAVNHPRRWDRRVQALREELAAGRWGAVRSAVGLYTNGVLNNGSHLIDLVLFLLGPATVIAVGPGHHDGFDDDPTVDALLALASGGVVHLVGGDARDFTVFELTIVTERGVIALEDSGFVLRIRHVEPSARFAGYRTLDSGTVETTGLDDALVCAVDNLRDAVRHGAALASDGRSALAAQEICDELRARAA